MWRSQTGRACLLGASLLASRASRSCWCTPEGRLRRFRTTLRRPSGSHRARSRAHSGAALGWAAESPQMEQPLGGGVAAPRHGIGLATAAVLSATIGGRCIQHWRSSPRVAAGSGCPRGQRLRPTRAPRPQRVVAAQATRRVRPRPGAVARAPEPSGCRSKGPCVRACPGARARARVSPSCLPGGAARVARGRGQVALPRRAPHRGCRANGARHARTEKRRPTGLLSRGRVAIALVVRAYLLAARLTRGAWVWATAPALSNASACREPLAEIAGDAQPALISRRNMEKRPSGWVVVGVAFPGSNRAYTLARRLTCNPRVNPQGCECSCAALTKLVLVIPL